MLRINLLPRSRFRQVLTSVVDVLGVVGTCLGCCGLCTCFGGILVWLIDRLLGPNAIWLYLLLMAPGVLHACRRTALVRPVHRFIMRRKLRVGKAIKVEPGYRGPLIVVTVADTSQLDADLVGLRYPSGHIRFVNIFDI